MSLFEGLDGVEEPLPTLIDEEDLLLGDDLFQLLDEPPPGERVPEDHVPAAPVVPVAPVVTVAPVAPVGPVTPATPNIPAAPAVPTGGPTLQNREPAEYIAPKFFPFGKPETTPPQLKLSGVSSFKKINSRLMQGGSLSEREEADAIRVLERALDVLGHQKRFLQMHKAGLEKWTSKVYGLNLSTNTSPPDESDETPSRAELATVKDGRSEPEQDTIEGRVHRSEIRLTLKCRGADKRRLDKKLIAEVDHGWYPGQLKTGDAKKRALSIGEAETPSKRGKATEASTEHAMAVRKNYSIDEVGKMAEDRQTEDACGPAFDVPDTPGQLWNWLKESNYFSTISRKQPLPEDLTLETEDRLGRTSLVPLRSCGSPSKLGSEPGSKVEPFEDDIDILRQRLTSALIVPGVVANVGATDVTAKLDGSELWTNPRRTDAFNVLDTSKLSLNQRVLVQLQGVGLINCTSSTCQNSARATRGAEYETQRLQQRLAESIKILNHSRVGLRRGISAST